MTESEILQRIAEKTIRFDREHFADDIEPRVDVLLRHHENLKNDPKLITRLQPRFKAALAFFEGYIRAFDDIALSLKEASEASIGIVLRPPPPPPPPAAPMSDEISDELAQAAADYANDRVSTGATNMDIELVRSTCVGKQGSSQDMWTQHVLGFVAGAQWQRASFGSRIAELEKQLDDELANLNETARENVKLANETIELRATIENTAKQGAEWRDLLETSEAERLAMKQERDRALAKVRAWEARTGETQPRIVEAKLDENRSTSIVFRDADETEYWDEMTFMLARKGDTTSKSVASAADEMVEERRTRMPKNEAPETQDKPSIDFEAQANEITRRLQDSEDFIERFRIELAKALGKDESLRLGDALSMVRSLVKAQSVEVTDELLSKAMDYSDRELGISNSMRTYADAKRALSTPVSRSDVPWNLLVRGYVNGARKT